MPITQLEIEELRQLHSISKGDGFLTLAAIQLLLARAQDRRPVSHDLFEVIFDWQDGRVPHPKVVLRTLNELSPTEQEFAKVVAGAAINHFWRRLLKTRRWQNLKSQAVLEEYFIRCTREPGFPLGPVEIARQLAAAEIEFIATELDSTLIELPRPDLRIVEDWRVAIAAIAARERTLHEMLDWRGFEDLVQELLRRFGWSTSSLGYTKDGGADILAATKIAPGIEFKMLVQCKRYAPDRPVGVDVVRSLWSVKWERGADKAMIATTSGFTKGAKKTASTWQLELTDHDAIVEWCSEALNRVL